MHKRIVVIAVSALLALFCVFVGSAAWLSAFINERAVASFAIKNPEVAARARAEALLALDQDWSGARLWHAGALENAAWLAYLQAVSNPNTDMLEQSASLTERSVVMAPINSAGWLRLSSLETQDIGTLCDERDCLENSFNTAPMGRHYSSLGCDRLRIGIWLGDITSTRDLRVRLYLSRDDLHWTHFYPPIAECLAGLPEGEVDAAVKAYNSRFNLN